MSELANQVCPFCSEKKCMLAENEIDIPLFGKVFVFSMECQACGARQSDVEPAEEKEPLRYTFELTSEEDLSVKVVKSGQAIVKIPHVITIEPGPVSEGYVTNVEGLLQRVQKVIQSALDAEEDDAAKEKARVLLKKVGRALVGREHLKIIVEDPSGYSAIISEKAQKSKL